MLSGTERIDKYCDMKLVSNKMFAVATHFLSYCTDVPRSENLPNL